MKNENTSDLPQQEVQSVPATEPTLVEKLPLTVLLRESADALDSLQAQLQQEKEHHEFYRDRVSQYMDNERNLLAQLAEAQKKLAAVKRIILQWENRRVDLMITASCRVDAEQEFRALEINKCQTELEEVLNERPASK